MRKLIAPLMLLAVLLPACGRGNDGPQRYAIDIDAKSTAKEKFQFSAFFPGEIKVAAGDSIKFRNHSTEAPHTITFGVKADRSNQPAIITATGENPVVLEPCDIDDAPTPKLEKCATTKLGAFDGTGYWNSGFLLPKPAPKEAGPKTTTVKFATGTPTGSYAFVCILHPFMNGNVEVVAERGDRTPVDDVRAAQKDGAAEVRSSAEDLEEPELNLDGDKATAAAGWGDKVTSVNRFAPAAIAVDAGTTVTWEVQNPYEPHTVTFGKTFEEPLPPEAFAPGGVKSGSDYTGGLSTSGLIGAEGTPFAGTFSLRFTKAGSYAFNCALHPGMVGAVEVT